MQLTINQRIKILFENSEFSERKFADKIGISVTGFRKIIQGESSPTSKTLDKICDAMPKINRSWITSGEGEMMAASDKWEKKSFLLLEQENEKLRRDNERLWELIETLMPKKIAAKLKGVRNNHEIAEKSYQNDLKVA